MTQHSFAGLVRCGLFLAVLSGSAFLQAEPPPQRRGEEQRALARKRYGAAEDTADAVQKALTWLKKQQQQDGSWSLRGPYKGDAAYENPVAATALALYTLQGDGNSDRAGDFKETVRLGWRALLKMQDQDGLFTSAAIENKNHLFYSHGLALLAVTDIYWLTGDKPYKDAAQRAVDYAVKNIDKQKGGWRYLPGNDADTSVTGWVCHGLLQAKKAGLDVPRATLDQVSAYLDSAQKENGATYAYRPGFGGVTAAISASGLLLRQHLGWKQDDDRLKTGVQKILGHPINKNDWQVYYWYHATQVCFNMQGDTWKTWNAELEKVVLPAQQTRGPEAGSWDPNLDEWGVQGGRIFITCLCTLMLETSSREPPLYEAQK